MFGGTLSRADAARVTAQAISIPQQAKDRLCVMYIAKHAKWGGGLHSEDGNHARCHVEVRSILAVIGLNLTPADSYEGCFAIRASTMCSRCSAAAAF